MIVSHFNHRLEDFQIKMKPLSKNLVTNWICGARQIKLSRSHKLISPELRLKFWNKLGENEKISLLVQGHHLNDFAETLLWRILEVFPLMGLLTQNL